MSPSGAASHSNDSARLSYLIRFSQVSVPKISDQNRRSLASLRRGKEPCWSLWPLALAGRTCWTWSTLCSIRPGKWTWAGHSHCWRCSCFSLRRIELPSLTGPEMFDWDYDDCLARCRCPPFRAEKDELQSAARWLTLLSGSCQGHLRHDAWCSTPALCCCTPRLGLGYALGFDFGESTIPIIIGLSRNPDCCWQLKNYHCPLEMFL